MISTSGIRARIVAARIVPRAIRSLRLRAGLTPKRAESSAVGAWLPSSTPEPYGVTSPRGPFAGELPITGALGDQQAATVGQVCFAPGEAKNTYGTGNFLLMNTGTGIVRSKAGLLTTVCFKFGSDPAVFALDRKSTRLNS